MKNKLSKNMVDNYNPEKITRYSIRKASFGATSVAVAAFFMYLGQGSAAAADNNIQNQENKISSTDKNKNSGIENTIEKTSKETVIKSETNTLDKTKLSSLIAEIESKIVSGAYDSKTEDSVSKLKVELGTVKIILENAKTQEELTRAYNKLTTATTQLKTKPEEKKETPAVDTTNGKATVGIKATNTEKSSESNSIANSGSKDERNGKALDKDNSFRADAATTDTDSAANQTYTAPAENADLATLADKLKTLDNYIENNKKVQDMDTLGNALNVEKGSVTEINEFGGWKAVGDSGKFAIARKTEAGVFPIETVNTVWADSTKSYVTWVLEQSFNRDSDYMLFLSKVRTKASSKEEAYDNSTYVSTGLGDKIAKGVKGFDGIQKTFKAYSKEHGSKVIVSFRTGYTGDIDGTKAQYKVEVIINRNGQEEKLYDQTFTPEVSKTNTEMTVVKASDGKNSPQSFSTPGTPLPTKAELEAKIANNKPNGTGGTFKSKEIELPEGVTEYTVRISSADNLHLGMGYQSPYRHYALPVTGSDFNVDQDTGTIAKDLLSRIYDKLKATESADTDGKTNETKAAYLAELENIKTLVTSTDVKKTVEYKEALEAILSKQLALKVDKTVLKNAKEALNTLATEADPTTGKTADSAKTYNDAKTAAQEAIQAAQTVIDNTDATVAQVKEALNKVNEKKAALEAAKQALVEAVTPVGKEKALEAIQAASEAKIASIDKNAKLSDDEKAAAKAEVAKAAIAAVNAINEAKDQDGVDAAQTTGVKAIEAVNPVGTSSTNSAGNGITPPTVEVPAYTDPVGTSSTDGEGNVITPPTVEVPAYTDPVGTSNTDGDGNVITPPTVEVPAYTDPVGTSSTDGAGNVITPPTAEVPAYTEPVGTSSTAGDGNVVTPPTAEVPAYTGSVNGISEEMPAQPHKDGSANEMSDGTPVSETTINKDRQLPNTGTADSTVAMVAAAASAVLGLGLAGRRRKEDEEA